MIAITTTSILRDTIESMDHISQAGLSEISAIARATLAQPDLDPKVVEALNAIWLLADDTMNDINTEAEEVGGHYSAC